MDRYQKIAFSVLLLKIDRSYLPYTTYPKALDFFLIVQLKR